MLDPLSEGHLAYWDTDGAAVVASPTGGEVELRDGRHIRALSWAEVDAVLARFDSLTPLDDGTPFWKVRRGERRRPWWGVFLAPKRWVFFTRTRERVAVTDASEHGLAGTLLAPPGRDDWSGEVADQLAANLADPDIEQPRFSWDAERPGFVAQRRRHITRPGDLDALPDSLGLAPFASYLEASSPIPGEPGPLAPDWGVDIDPFQLPWSHRDGRPAHVSADPADPTMTPVETLATKAAKWGGHELLDPSEPIVEPEPVHVHPALIRYVGRTGGKYRGDPSQLVYQDVDIARLLTEATDALGASTVAAMTRISKPSLRRLSHGHHPRASTLARAVEALQTALPDASDPLAALAERARAGRRCLACGRHLTGRQQSWCSNACRMSATRTTVRPAAVQERG
jgi:hypothetical protein